MNGFLAPAKWVRDWLDYWLGAGMQPSIPTIATHYRATEYPMSGELLNDEYALRHHPLAPFDPDKDYRVRVSFKGREVIGEWE